MQRILIAGSVLAVAVAGMGTVSAAPAVYKVTGGGLDPARDRTARPLGGAGTVPWRPIAFTAQSAEADGQDRTAGKGQLQETVHGTITCVVVFSNTDRGGVAVLGGVTRAGDPVRIDVMDNGEGRTSTDLIRLSRDGDALDGGDEGDEGTDESLCDPEDERADTELGRGNVQVHKAKR